MRRSIQARRTVSRELLLIGLPFVLSVLFCGCVAWLTLFMGHGKTEAAPRILPEVEGLDDLGTVPGPESGSGVVIAGETQ